jgi:hypothetical protein
MAISDVMFEIGDQIRTAQDWYFDGDGAKTFDYTDEIKARVQRILDDVDSLRSDLDYPPELAEALAKAKERQATV